MKLNEDIKMNVEIHLTALSDLLNRVYNNND